MKGNARVKSRVKTALCMVAVVSLATAGGVATHASYTDSGESVINAQSGNLSMTVSTEQLLYGNPAIFSTKKLLPGQPLTENVTITNTGTVPLKYDIMKAEYSNPLGGPFTNALVVTAVVDGDTIYNGSLSDFHTSLRTIPAGNYDVVEMTYLWPENTDLVEIQKWSDGRIFEVRASS